MNYLLARIRIHVIVHVILALGWIYHFPLPAEAADSLWQEQTVTFLGTSLDKHRQPRGVVAKVSIALRKRSEQGFLNISFSSRPGKFSPLTQVSIQDGIKASAEAANLDPSTWDVFLMFPYPGVTVYGESLSAMVSLAVLAMANHDPILANRVITGKVTSDGRIGAVGGIPLKIQAAFAAHIQRVIIPEDRSEEDNEWQTPFLMHISYADSVVKAYDMLTGRGLPIHKNEGRSQGSQIATKHAID
jgi:predicted S18 family serine protease